MTMNGDTATILGSVLFVLLLALAVLAANLGQREANKKEIRRRALETLQRKAELRRQKEQEAADSYLLEKVEEYRNDFDGHSS